MTERRLTQLDRELEEQVCDGSCQDTHVGRERCKYCNSRVPVVQERCLALLERCVWCSTAHVGKSHSAAVAGRAARCSKGNHCDSLRILLWIDSSPHV